MGRMLFIVGLVAAVAFVARILGNAPPCRNLDCHLLGVNCPDFVYSGHVEEGFEGFVTDVLEENFKRGYEIGCQVTVFHMNRKVVDISAGYTDRNFKEPYLDDALQLVFSSTKVVTAIAVMMLVDRGLLDFETPIAYYWPEFAQNGKEKVTVGDLMSHAGGVHHVSEKIDLDVILAQGSPLRDILARTKLDKRTWRKEGGQGYHGVSRGLYANELCKIVDGRSLREFVKEEIIQPLSKGKHGPLDFSIGLVEEMNGKVGSASTLPLHKIWFGLIPRLVMPTEVIYPMFDDISISPREKNIYLKMEQEGTVNFEAFGAVWGEPNTPKSIADYFQSDSEWPNILSPSTHGFTRAKALAVLGNVMVNGGTDPDTNITIVSKETLEKASRWHTPLFDQVFQTEIVFSEVGLGDVFQPAFGIAVPSWMDSDNFKNASGKCVGWGGAGGSLFQWCPELQLSFAYTMNYYAPHIIDW